MTRAPIRRRRRTGAALPTGPVPPGPRSLVPGRLPLSFARDRLAFIKRATDQYGDVVFFRLAGAPFAILNHPDHVRDVLVARHRLFHKGLGLERARMLLGNGLLTSEDEVHARQRRLILPAFHRERIAGYGDVMVECARRRSERWREGETLDMSREMGAIALGVAARSLFDTSVEEETSRIGEALTAALRSFNLAMLPYGDRLVRLPLPAARRFRRARAELDSIICRLIGQRRAGPTSGTDLLSLLVSAHDEGDGGGMSDEQLRDEALTLLLAGHETTALALAWAWHLLARNPGAEAALHEEVDRVLPGRPPVADDYPRLVYARAVLAESMRLFPPAYFVGRRALAPYDVPGTSFVLPANTAVFLTQYWLHRDPRFWPEPERFAPERWLGETAAGRPLHRYAYFPFGGGPRTCIGEGFAWLEGVLVLATLAGSWRFRNASDRPIDVQPMMTLRARRGGIPMVGQIRGQGARQRNRRCFVVAARLLRCALLL